MDSATLTRICREHAERAVAEICSLLGSPASQVASVVVNERQRRDGIVISAAFIQLDLVQLDTRPQPPRRK